MRMTFDKTLKMGRGGEEVIISYLKRQGYSCARIERENQHQVQFEGPRLYSAAGAVRAPDILSPEFGLIEAKTKTGFSWHWTKRHWDTGIDQHCWKDYLQTAQSSKMPYWVFFVHQATMPRPYDINQKCPTEAPAGLYAQQVLILADTVCHSDARWARGMVYWAESSLLKLEKVL